MAACGAPVDESRALPAVLRQVDVHVLREDERVYAAGDAEEVRLSTTTTSRFNTTTTALTQYTEDSYNKSE